MAFSQGIFVFIYLTFLQAVIFWRHSYVATLNRDHLFPSFFLPTLPPFLLQTACEILVSQPGAGPMAGKTPSLNHWTTREFLKGICVFCLCVYVFFFFK